MRVRVPPPVIRAPSFSRHRRAVVLSRCPRHHAKGAGRRQQRRCEGVALLQDVRPPAIPGATRCFTRADHCSPRSMGKTAQLCLKVMRERTGHRRCRIHLLADPSENRKVCLTSAKLSFKCDACRRAGGLSDPAAVAVMFKLIFIEFDSQTWSVRHARGNGAESQGSLQ